MELKYKSPYEVKLNNLNIKKNNLVITPLTESIREFGLISPIVVDCEGNVIDGNERLEISRAIRLDKVPVLETNLTPEQGQKYAVIVNHIQQLAGWNFTPKKNLVEKLNINKGIYHMADEIRDMQDINGMFTEDDAISLFYWEDEEEEEPGIDMFGDMYEDNSSGL